MTKVTLPLEQEAITITKDVTLSMVRDFLDITGFPVEYIPVLTNEIQGESKQLRNFYEKCDPGEIRTNYMTYAFYGYNEIHEESSMLANNHRMKSRVSTIADKKRQLFLHPLHHPTKIEVTLKIRTMDLTILNRWLSYFKIASSHQKFSYHIDANYNYAIPQKVMCFVMDNFDRLNEAGENLVLKDYLAEILQTGVKTRSNLNGSYIDIIAFEKQSNCLASITDVGFFNSKELENGIYEVTVPIVFEYDKPLGFELDFPVFVANRPIDRSYIDAWVPAIDRKLHKSYPQLWDMGLYAISRLSRFYKGDGGTRLYEYDEFFPENGYKDTQTITLFPFQVVASDLQDVVNLNDLPDDLIPTAIKDYIVEFTKYNLEYSKSLVVLEVFELGDEAMRLSHTVDSDLNVRVVGDMAINQMHYCRISIKRDLAKLSAYSTTELLKHRNLAFALLKLYDPGLKATDDSRVYYKNIPSVIPVGRDNTLPSLLLVTETEINSRSYHVWLKKLRHTSQWLVDVAERNSRTVMSPELVALRR